MLIKGLATIDFISIKRTKPDAELYSARLPFLKNQNYFLCNNRNNLHKTDLLLQSIHFFFWIQR